MTAPRIDIFSANSLRLSQALAVLVCRFWIRLSDIAIIAAVIYPLAPLPQPLLPFRAGSGVGGSVVSVGGVTA
jgi:hypothetical protein